MTKIDMLRRFLVVMLFWTMIIWICALAASVARAGESSANTYSSVDGPMVGWSRMWHVFCKEGGRKALTEELDPGEPFTFIRNADGRVISTSGRIPNAACMAWGPVCRQKVAPEFQEMMSDASVFVHAYVGAPVQTCALGPSGGHRK